MSSATSLEFVNRNDFLHHLSSIVSQTADTRITSAERVLYQVQVDLRDAVMSLKRETSALKASVVPSQPGPKEASTPDQGQDNETAQPALREECIAWADSVINTLGKIDVNITEYRRRNRFALQHGNGRMVCVFGKVKAGKSSLGNYVAYGSSSPTPAMKNAASPEPRFFYETGSGLNEVMSTERMAAQKSFGIGIAETTASIQGFTLPGLTWVDTPGVDSVNAANGDLTYQYVDACDLIIYTLNSSSPQRESDRVKIISFLRRSKPLLLVITACDSVDEDEGPDGEIIRVLNMKDDDVRREQCEGVRRFIESALSPVEAALYDFLVLSVSARVASEGHGEPDELWRKSGMQEFFATLSGVCQAQGSSAREATSLRDVSDTVKVALAHLEKCDAAGRTFLNEIEGHSKEVGAFCREAPFAFYEEARMTIVKLADDLADSKDNERLRSALIAARTEVVAKVIMKARREFGYNALGNPQYKVTSINTLVDYEDVFLTSTYKSSMGSNLCEVAGGIVGGVAGAAGGPVGAIALGAVGNFVGKMVGSLFNGSVEKKVKTGDNRAAVAASATSLFETWIKEVAGPVENWLNSGIASYTSAHLSLLTDVLTRHRSSLSGSLKSLEMDAIDDAS